MRGHRFPASQGSPRAYNCIGAEEIWFSDWKRGGVLLEEARHLAQWDRTLTLLWFEDEELPASGQTDIADSDDDEPLLRELDGVLPWPGKKRRK